MADISGSMKNSVQLKWLKSVMKPLSRNWFAWACWRKVKACIQPQIWIWCTMWLPQFVPIISIKRTYITSLALIHRLKKKKWLLWMRARVVPCLAAVGRKVCIRPLRPKRTWKFSLRTRRWQPQHSRTISVCIKSFQVWRVLPILKQRKWKKSMVWMWWLFQPTVQWCVRTTMIWFI